MRRTAHTLPAAAALAALTLAMAGCGEATDDMAPGADVLVRDSAGIRIVESGPVEGRQPLVRISEEPLFHVGWDGDGPLLQFVPGGAIMSGDRFAVADLNRFYVLDRTGAVLAEIGQPGDGPGEFDRISGVVALGGDSLLIHDLGNYRMSVFEGDELLFDRRTPPGTLFNFHAIRARTADGSLVMTNLAWFPQDGPPGEWFQAPVVRAAVDSPETDTLFWYDNFPFGLDENPFDQVGQAAAAGPRIAYARSDIAEVRWFDLDGTLRQIGRWEPTWVELTDELWADYETVYREGRPASADPARIEEALAERRADARGPLPLFRVVYGDPAGNVWMAPYLYPTRAYSRYRVFIHDGRWAGALDLPPNFLLLDVNDEYALGVQTNELGVYAAVVYGVEWD